MAQQVNQPHLRRRYNLTDRISAVLVLSVIALLCGYLFGSVIL